MSFLIYLNFQISLQPDVVVQLLPYFFKRCFGPMNHEPNLKCVIYPFTFFYISLEGIIPLESLV